MKRSIYFVLLFVLICSIGGIFFLPFVKIDLGTASLRAALEKILETATSYSIEIGDIHGNPLGGFTINDVVISNGQAIVGQVSTLSIRPSLLSLATDHPRLKRLRLEKFSLSIDHFLSFKKEEARRWNLPQDIVMDIIVSQGKITSSSLGIVDIGRGKISVNNQHITVDGRVKINNAPLWINMEGQVGERISVKYMNFKIAEGTIQLSGYVCPEIGLAGKIENVNLSKFMLAFPPAKKTIDRPLEGTVSSSIILRGRWPSLVAEGQLSVEKGHIWGFDVSQGTTRWAWDGKTLSFLDINGLFFGSNVQGNIVISPQKMVQIDVTGHELKTAEWYGVFPWLRFAQGTLDTLRVELAIHNGKREGVTTFTSTSAVLSGFPLEKLTGKLFFSPEHLITVDASGLWHATPVKGKGTITIKEKGANLDLAFDVPKLSLKNIQKITPEFQALLLEGDVSAAVSLQGLSTSPEIQGEIRSKRIRIKGNILESFALDFIQKGNITTISSFAALFQKTSIKGGGEIQHLFAKEEPICNIRGNMNNLSSAALETLLPDIKPLHASGSLSATWQISGSLKDPIFTINAKGENNKIFEKVPLQDLEMSGKYRKNLFSLDAIRGRIWGGLFLLSGTFDIAQSGIALNITGDIRHMKVNKMGPTLAGWQKMDGEVNGTFNILGTSRAPLLTAIIEGENMTLSGLLFDKVTAKIEGTPTELQIETVTAMLAGSLLEGAGTFSVGKGLNMNITIPPTNLQAIVSQWLSQSPVDGNIAGEISISGPLQRPSISATGTSQHIRIGGLVLSDVSLKAQPQKDGAFVFSLDGIYKNVPVTILGGGDLAKDGWEISLTTGEKGIPLELLAANGNGKGRFSGFLNASWKGKVSEKGLRGSGLISSSEMKLYGFTLSRIQLPIETSSDGKFLITDGEVQAYGGEGTISGSFDPQKFRWDANVIVEGLDLEKASIDWLPPEGKLSGEGTLKLDASGTMGQLKFVFGSGSLYIKEGAIEGFPLVKKVSGTDKIGYRSIMANFNLDGRSLYLLPGSRISAFTNDPVYRYLNASGSLGFGDKTVSLKCTGDINLKALNALLGGIKGLISVGDNITDPLLLQKFLSGLLGGYYSVRDFREASFTLEGTWDNLKMYDLKVSQPVQKSPIPTDSSFTREKRDDEIDDITIKLSFPTGEGKDSSLSPGEQVKKQLMENLLKQIIKPEEIEEISPSPSKENDAGASSSNGGL